MKMIIFAFVILLLTGCNTINCTLMSGERNTYKSDQDQTAKTPVTTNVSGIPGL